MQTQFTLKIKKFIKRVLDWGSPEKYVRKLHEQKGYLEAYSAHTEKDYSDEYPHPIGQKMVEIKKK